MHPFHGPTRRRLYPLIWALLAALHTAGWYGLYNLPWMWLCTDGLIAAGVMGLLIWVVINALSVYQPPRNRWIVTLIITLVITFLWYHVHMALDRWLIADDATRDWIESGRVPRLIIGFLIVLGIVSNLFTWFRLEEETELKRREMQIQSQRKRAELFSLRQQFQPHFLFNSLNSIHALIPRQPEQARRMTETLAQYLRKTLNKDEGLRVSLQEEWQDLEAYFAIELMRFGHRLKLEKDLTPGALSWKIPVFILQPLLENAIKFSVYGTTEEARIGCSAHVEQGMLHLVMQNNFDPDYPDETRGTGFGLKSVYRRMALTYGRSDLVQTHSENALFIVTLKFPADV